ncbi:MAG: GntR family transcriptional regulator [Lachnospiraceae bacterium]|nr:GntR family transcriptional regulator [Lachnospiraceae bacterium]
MHIAERLSGETGRDYAMRVLKDNIIRLELEPGSIISDRELAAGMNLSRTPVREAFLELAKVKIVEIYPQRGTMVSFIDYNLVEEARFIRSVLEVAVVRLACGLITPEQMEELEDNIRLQKFYHQNLSVERMLELDNEFHRMLFWIANKRQAYEMMDRITIHFDRVRNLAISAVKEHKWMEEHYNIYEAVRDNDPEQAARLMETHLKRYQVDEEAIRQSYPQYFKHHK